MSGMNRLFEQDPQFPYFGSREEQSDGYSASAKYPAPDDKKIQSGSAPTAGGPVRKVPPRTTITHNLPSYSRKNLADSKTVRKKSQVSMSDSDDDVPLFNFEVPKSDSDDDVPIFGKKQDDASDPNRPSSLSLLTAKPSALAASREIRRKIERIHQGETKVELIHPAAALPDLAGDVEKLVEACIIWPVTSLELQVSDSRLCRRSIQNDLSRDREPLLALWTRVPCTLLGASCKKSTAPGGTLTLLGSRVRY